MQKTIMNELGNIFITSFSIEIRNKAKSIFKYVLCQEHMWLELHFSLQCNCDKLYLPFIDILYNAMQLSYTHEMFYQFIMEACVDSFSAQKLMLNLLEKADDILVNRCRI